MHLSIVSGSQASDDARIIGESRVLDKGSTIFVRGKLAEQITFSMGEHIGIEVYSTKRFFTVTGQHLASTPTEIREAQPALDQLWAEYHKEPAPAEPRKVIERKPIDFAGKRTSLDEVKARFNADNPLDQLLQHYGAVQYSGKDFSCPFCQHTHTNTLYVFKDRVFSRSPGCIIPMKRGLDSAGLEILVKHNNDSIAFARAVNPIQPAQQAQEAPEIIAARKKDAQRKREQRQQAADTLRETILGRAAIDEDMPWQAREVIGAHLTLAGQRGWHRASIARMAEMLGRGDRWVQRFNEYLIDSYVSRTLTSRHDTAIWTLLEKPIERVDTPETAILEVIETEAESNDDHPIYILENTESTDLFELARGGYPPRTIAPIHSTPGNGAPMSMARMS